MDELAKVSVSTTSRKEKACPVGQAFFILSISLGFPVNQPFLHTLGGICVIMKMRIQRKDPELKNTKTALISVALLVSLTMSGCSSSSTSTSASSEPSPDMATPSVEAQQPLPTVDVTNQPIETGQEVSTKLNDSDEEAKLLVYLIEEEKLAHDVYSELSTLWGSRVFSNILQSEVSHQGQVLALLEARAISDPRSAEVGVFTNATLQNLFNELVAKGSKSTKDAFEVGVAIEELDIQDITEMLGKTLSTDVIATLERLRAASENHLRAFNRQL